MTRVLKYLTALLALWLIVEVSVFPSGAALWIAFATGIAIGAVAFADVAFGVAEGRRIAPGMAAATGLLAAFLILASFVFEGASLSWLMAIAGGVIEALALAAVGLPRLHVSSELAKLPSPGEEERPREEARLAA